MDNLSKALTRALTNALEAGGYNSKPTRLRQGCILYVGPELTEAETDQMWIKAFGHKGYCDCEESGDPTYCPLHQPKNF